MCYYNGVKVTRAEYIRLKNLEKSIANLDLNRPVEIGFEYNHCPVLKRRESEIDFDIVQMEWGFIPHYINTRDDITKMRFGYKDDMGKFHPPITTLNAMSEEILKPGKIYRNAALKRRCLVLSSGFYEWRHIFPLNKRTGVPNKTAIKYPYHISVKDKEYFYMAGVWQPWTDRSTGETIECFAIVTTKANSLMEQVHNNKKRMPTILPDDLAYEWLFGDLDESRIFELATYQFHANQMEACSIAKDFLAAVEPTKAFEYEDLPALDLVI